MYITNSVSDDAENQKLHDMVEKICRDNQVEITDDMAELVKIKNGERIYLCDDKGLFVIRCGVF